MRIKKVVATAVASFLVAGAVVAGSPTAGADPGGTMVVAWGDNTYGQTDVPAGLDDVVAVSAGTRHSLAMRSDGTVVAWGDNEGGQIDVPAGLTDVVAVSAGGDHSLALKSDGTVVLWGGLTPFEWDGQMSTVGALYGYIPVPDGLTDVVAIEAGGSTNLVLKSDGSNFGWGYIPLSNGDVDVVDITVGPNFSYLLRANGELALRCAQSSRCEAGLPWEVGPLTDVTTGSEQALGLRPDGTVVQWGDSGQYRDWVPAGLSGVASVEAGGAQFYALGTDGTLTGWTYDGAPIAAMPSDLGPVLAVSAGQGHTLAVVESGASDTTAPGIAITAPTDGAAFALGEPVTVAYACTDDVAVDTCTGTVADGSLLDTSTPGAATFVVDATDTSGNPATASVGYTVSTALADGLALSGSFTSIPAGYDVSVVDDGAAGVTVSVVGSGTEKVEMSVCGGFTVRIAPGSVVTLACGSVIATVLAGEVEVAVTTALGPVSVTIPQGATAEVGDDGGVAVTGPVPVSVSLGGAVQTVGEGQDLAVSLRGTGVLDPAHAWTKVPAGLPVLLNFRIFYGAVEITDPAAVGSIVTTRVACPGKAPVAPVVKSAVLGSTGLRHTPLGFMAAWQTPREPGTCTTVTITSASGSTLSAPVELTKPAASTALVKLVGGLLDLTIRLLSR